jgi:hypothetical protein
MSLLPLLFIISILAFTYCILFVVLHHIWLFIYCFRVTLFIRNYWKTTKLIKICSCLFTPWHGYSCQGPWHWYPWFVFGLRTTKIMAPNRSRWKDKLNKEVTMLPNIAYEFVSYPTRTLRPGHLYKRPGGASGGTSWDLSCNLSFVSIIQSDLPCLSVLPLSSFDAPLPPILSHSSKDDIDEANPHQLAPTDEG